MTTGSYEEPDWAIQPSAESSWMLTEIKSGVETAKHELYTRSTTIIGRAVDMVHIPLHHESISRQHARISFDSMGQPWLRDLQSSHGSFVNKKKLPRESIGKVESNSLHKGTRGIKLFVGDILTFGASTRYFSLAGDDTMNQQVKLKLPPQQQNETPSPEKSLSTSNNNTSKKKVEKGVSWGISMADDDDVDSDNDNHVNNNGEKTIATDQIVSDKHRAQLDKLNVMKNKLINLETEDARIRRKGELTEGQEKQLQRNAEREVALKKSIIEREENLYDKINGNKDRKKSKAERKAMMEYKNSLEEDDDDYFDRTKAGSSTDKNNDTNHSNEAESEATLTQKWNKIVEEQKHLNDVALHKANNRVNTLHDRLKQAQASGDEEEFFLNNDLQLAREAKKKIDSSLVVGNTTINEIEKLLKVVNPKIYYDRNSGYIGEGRPSSSSSSCSAQEDGSNKLSGTMAPPPPPTLPKQTAMAPPPPPPLPQQTTNTTEVCKKKQIESESIQNNHDDTSAPTGNSIGDFIMPPPGKRKRLLGPTMPPPQPTPSSAIAPKSSSHKQAGTLSFLNQMSTVNTSKDSTKSTTKSSKQNNIPNPSQPRTGMDTKKDEWVAPKGQDGSGRTKLNEKFAGRY